MTRDQLVALNLPFADVVRLETGRRYEIHLRGVVATGTLVADIVWPGDGQGTVEVELDGTAQRVFLPLVTLREVRTTLGLSELMARDG